MKSNQKGFTLIELLAVIVILAIIALIATPIVLNIIAKARKSAAQDSVYGVMSAVRLAYMDSLLDTYPQTLPFSVTCDDNDCTYIGKDEDGADKDIPLVFQGTKPTKGTITLSKEAKFADTTADTKIEISGHTCTIKNQGVSCVAGTNS